MIWTYLVINVIIILFPLIFTLNEKIKYYKKLKYVFFSIITIGSLYVFWDIIATMNNHWYFNPNYILGIKFLIIPIEELLFFITVPYSCLFIYESLKYFKFKNKQFNNKIKLSEIIPYSFATLFLSISILIYHNIYTFIVMIVTGITIIIIETNYQEIFRNKLFWYYMGISFVCFLIFNGILTSIPIVSYNINAILGIKFFTIPIEDFFYNFSMLTGYFLFYIIGQKILKK